MQTLRQFVSGTDFSECAEQALELAVQLAVAALARVTVVHVCESDDMDERRLNQCKAALAKVVARHRRSGVDVTGVLRSGKPWKKLDNVAVELGASLIVVGRHGAGRGRSVEIGSVADQLVRSANRSVLTVTCDFECLGNEANATDQP